MIKPIKFEEGMTPEVGNYYLSMPNETYHATKGFISKSGLDIFHKDPYKYFNQKPREQTRAMQIGSAIHAAILEPEVFEREFMLLPEIKDRRQAEYKQAVKSFGVGNVFTDKDCEKISGIKNAVWANDEARKLLSADGHCEISGFSVDEETGVKFRHRFDKLACVNGEWFGVDVKKTQSVDEFKFSRSMWDYRYHVQDALYSRGFKSIAGKELAGFFFIAVEEEYPHKVAVFELCSVSQSIAETELNEDLALYSEYAKGNIKAHNNSQSTIISLPEWVLREYENEVI